MSRTGEKALRSGQFTCSLCGEVVHINQGETLPPCPAERKAVEWRLAKAA